MNKTLTFITGNQGKLEQVKRYLNYPIEHLDLDLEEIQSLDLERIVEHKAKQAYGIMKKPVLVEDVSLTFNNLGNLPGPFIKWFLKEIDNDGLCSLINGDRAATAKVCYGFYDGEILETFTGEIRGKIASAPRGNKDFGWSPIFTPDGSKKTLAELETSEYEQFSMRKIALDKLAQFLEKHLS